MKATALPAQAYDIGIVFVICQNSPDFFWRFPTHDEIVDLSLLVFPSLLLRPTYDEIVDLSLLVFPSLLLVLASCLCLVGLT